MLIDFKLVLSTFLMIFLAELGDKTQISIFALATSRASLVSVFVGAVSALFLTTVIAVALGSVVGKLIPEKVIKILAGAVFISFGAFTLYGAFKT
jgi:putative Ca2+/H+ antiporter (TMEM165/GDT1 family)